MRKLSDQDTIALMISRATGAIRESAPSAPRESAPTRTRTVKVAPMGRTSRWGAPRTPSSAEAGEFLLATRMCSEGEGKFAIALFTGTYNYGEPYGSQLDAARAQARKMLASPNPREYTRSGAVSAEALLHTPGLPNPTLRNIDHLIGVRRSLTSDLCERERSGYDTSIVEAQINEINRQIAQYGLR